MATINFSISHQQMSDNLAHCALLAFIFDLMTVLFCLLIALYMWQIAPVLPSHLLAFSFCLPYALIYVSLAGALFVDWIWNVQKENWRQ
jgi:hypothetical protein